VPHEVSTHRAHPLKNPRILLKTSANDAAWILRFHGVVVHQHPIREVENMRRLWLVPALGVAALALTAPVQAQTRGWLEDGRSYSAPAQQSYYDSGRVAYDTGFREGFNQG
jgi:hypothetical protein